MNEQLQNFYYSEQDQGRLVFEDVPEYSELLEKSMALFPDGDLPREIGMLLDTANCISFAHGLRVGLTLQRWAAAL